MYLRLKDLREDKDYTQQDIANYLACSRSTYSNYEQKIRNVPVETLWKLADLYNTSVDYLIGRTDEIKPYSKSEIKYE